MIKIENTDVYGFEAAIRGMRNPMKSWDKSDTCFKLIGSQNRETMNKWQIVPEIGENDMKLMKQLVKAGSDHSKFMRMITVTADITAPMYWWKEMDTYKVGTVRNSCSTMHTIHKKPFELNDFSMEYVTEMSGEYPDQTIAQSIVNLCENYRKECLRSKDKRVWYALIQLLPSSYNQRATWQANYAVLRNIYHARKNHKLDEWREFCAWVESLPYSELITYSKEEEIR